MTAAQTGAALAADRVDLVDEDDGRRVLLGLVKQVAHAGCADADVEFNEVGAGDGEEGNARLTCNGLCKKGLTCTGQGSQSSS